MKHLLARIVTLSLLFAAYCTQSASAQAKQGDDAVQQLRKLNQVYRYLNAAYIDEVEMSPLVEKAIAAMLQELDPHSTYISPEEMKSVSIQLDGEFSGIGIEFRVLRDTIVVTNTITGAPAADVGILPNDRIVAIDGKSVIGIRTAEVPNLLRGKTGTKVEVDVARRGFGERLKFAITRDKIPMHTIDAAYKVNDNIGYVKINRFGHTTSREFTDALNRLNGVGSYIIDLRGNGGGIMSAAVEIAENFLPLGATIVSTEGRMVPHRSVKSRINGSLQRENVVVLIDESSASASEILAGALQDWDRAVIIGRNSFGKGLVQRQFEFDDKSAVRITVAKYLTPSGRAIQRPYEKGHRDEYYKSYRDRILHPDSVRRDSVSHKINHTLVLNREIPEGEGIVPDIEVPADTTRVSPYIIGIVGKGLLHEYLYDYLGSNADKLSKQYPSFERFERDFVVDDRMLSELSDIAKRAGIDMTGADAAYTDGFLRTQLKALIARRLFTSGEYYRIINDYDDEVFAHAVDVLSDWENSGKRIIGR